MSSEKKFPSSNVPFRITKTRLVLDADLQNKALIGYVEHFITDITPNLKMFNLHCSDQCVVGQAKAVSALDNSTIKISKVRHQTFPNILERDLTKNGKETYCLEEFVQHNLTVEESMEDQGSLYILFENPIECQKVILRLYFRVLKPRSGVFFFTNSEGEHFMYTHSQLKGARLWFPTVDNTNVFASYEFEITTSSDYYVVCSGKLVQQLQNSNGSLRTAFFSQPIPMAPQSVSIVIGQFDIYPKTFSKDGPDMNYLTVFYPRNKFTDYQIKRTTKIMEFVKNDVENFLSVNIVKSEKRQGRSGFINPGDHQERREEKKEGVLDNYAIIFLEDYFQPSVAYAGISILSTDFILEPFSCVTIERNIEVWSELCYLFCRQLFGNFLVEKMWTDTWLLIGFAGWVTFHFQEKRFGKNAIRFTMLEEIRKLKKMEEFNTPLCPVVVSGSGGSSSGGGGGGSSSGRRSSSSSLRENPLLRTEELSKEYIRRKSPLVIYMIGQHIRVETMGDVLQQFAVSAINHGRRELSTKNFLNRLKRFENFDIRNFANYWIYGTGVLDLECGYEYDPKKNVVCLAMKQVLPHPGHQVFRGVMEVVINEKSGPYVKSVKMDKEYTYDEFVCRSKGIRKKGAGRPKVKGAGRGRPPNSANPPAGSSNPPKKAEVTSPINSIRFDPGLKLLRSVSFPQPLSNLFDLLHQGQDVETQCTAINTLVMEFPRDPMARHKVLEELHSTIINPCIYHMVRIHALKGMVAIGLQFPEVVENVAKFVIDFFKEKFFTKDNELKKNDFSDFELYFLKKEIPYQLSFLRIIRRLKSGEQQQGDGPSPSSSSSTPLGNVTESGVQDRSGGEDIIQFDTPSVVVNLIWKIIKFNDNSENYFSDVFYIARVIQAIGNLSITDSEKKTEVYDFLQTKLVVDSLLPSYLYVNTIASMKGLTRFFLNVENFTIMENNSLDFNFFRERLDDSFPHSVRIIALKSVLKLFSSPRLWGLPIHIFPSRPDPIRPPCPNGAPEQVELFYHFFDHVLVYIYSKEESPFLRTKFLSVLNRYFQLAFKRIVLLHRKSSSTPGGNITGNITVGNLSSSTPTPTLDYTRQFHTSANFSVHENGKSVLGEFLVRVATCVHPYHQKWVKKFWMTLRNERMDQRLRISVLDLYLTMFGYDATPVCMRNMVAWRGGNRNPQHVIVPPALQDIPKEGQIRIMPTTPMSPTTPFPFLMGTSYFPPSKFGGGGNNYNNNSNDGKQNNDNSNNDESFFSGSSINILSPEDQPLSMNRKRKWRNEGDEKKNQKKDGGSGGFPLSGGDDEEKKDVSQNSEKTEFPELKRRKIEESLESEKKKNSLENDKKSKKKKKKKKKKKSKKRKKKKKKKKKSKMMDEDVSEFSSSSSESSSSSSEEEEEENVQMRDKKKKKKKKKKKVVPPPPPPPRIPPPPPTGLNTTTITTTTATPLLFDESGDMVVERGYIFPPGIDEQTLAGYFRSVQSDDEFRILFSYEEDFREKYIYENEHFFCLVFNASSSSSAKNRRLGCMIELYVQSVNYPNSSYVTAREILHCLPIQSGEVDDDDEDEEEGKINGPIPVLKLSGEGVRGLAWFRLPDPPRVGKIPDGEKQRNKVYKSQKEIGLWRPEDGKQYLVLGYSETDFYNDAESAYQSNIGFYNQRFSKIVFRSPLNVFGRVFKGHHDHVSRDGLHGHYNTSNISLYRPKRILISTFRVGVGEGEGGEHMKCLEVDLYPTNPVSERFEEVLKRVSVASSTRWFRTHQTDVMYFSYVTLDAQGNTDERSLRLTDEYRDIALRNREVCLKGELRPGEVAIDYITKVVYIASPILGKKKVYKKKKKKRNILKKKMSMKKKKSLSQRKPGVPSVMSYEVAVIGKVVSVESLEELWNSPYITCDNQGITNMKMWVRGRVIKITIMKKNKNEEDEEDEGENEDEDGDKKLENKKKNQRVREFMVEVDNTVTGDLIFQALPMVTRVKTYTNNKYKFVGFQLNSEFSNQIPYEPNVSDRRIKDDEFGLWKNGQMIVCCNNSVRRGLPFPCNVWGRYRGVLGKMKIDFDDFQEDDVIRIERVTLWK